MLWTLVVSLFLAGRALGQQTCEAGPGKTQSGSNNYVIDYFSSSLLFTYAIGQCTAVDLLDSSKYVKYTCMQQGSTWWVTKSTYTTKTCTGTSSSTSWNDSVAEDGQLGYFECDGNNNYARVQISIDSGCAGALDVYGGLGGCAQNPSSFDTKFYCNSTSALVQLYLNPTAINATQIPMCNDNLLYCTKWTFRAAGCAKSAQLNGVDVYGKMITCETSAGSSGTTTTMSGSTTTMSGTTTTGSGTTEMMTTSSAKSFSVLSAIVALFVGLFY